MARFPPRPGELLFALAGLPVALVGAVYVFAVLYAGTILSVTLVGLPFLAAGLRGGRLLGELHRSLIGRLLGESIERSWPPAAERGLVAWTRAGLTDPAGWRALAYLGLRVPGGLLSFAAAVLPLFGLWLAGFPLWIRLISPDDPGPVWWSAVSVPSGLVLLALFPAALRWTGQANVLLARLLLSPSPGQKRVHALQRARRILAVESTENLRWIERDLHDGTQAELVAIAITLSLADDALPGGERLPELIARARTQTDNAIAGLRRITHGINPVALEAGLADALPTLTAGCPIPVDLGLDLRERPDPAIERVVYFCAAELLTNIAKHSGARTATVEVVVADGRVRVRVTDDGKGGATATGSGLAGLAKRLEAVDGTLEIVSPPGGGTVITAELPARV